MHLLDTDVIWALRDDRGASTAVAAWVASVPRASLFVSALTLAELGAGATRLERRDKAVAAAVSEWLAGQVVPAFSGQVLAVDGAVARRATGLGLPNLRDGLLAAVALEHGLTLATRDAATFKAARVKTYDPWRYSPETKEDPGDWREATRGGPLWLKNLFVRG